jgi:hypothetical protein
VPEHTWFSPTAQLCDAYWPASSRLCHSLPSCVCTGARAPQCGPARHRGPVWRTAMLWVAGGTVALSLLSVMR